MAKTIKFNLICDEHPVRTIEDLQNNFSIEDVLEYYNNKLLHRWLNVRGYSKEYEQVSSISVTEPMDIIKELIRIFDIDANEKSVEENIYILQYLNERKELCSIYKNENYNATRIIEDYEAGYRQLVNEIIDNPDDAAKIKANIAEIVENYAWILKLNHRNLFYVLKEKSKLAIMCLLMNEKVRSYYLPIEIKDQEGKMVKDISTNYDKKLMFDDICKIIKDSKFEENIGINLKSFAGITDGYWKDLEPKGKHYMIISMEQGDYVRASGENGGDLSSSDIENKFIILDGIDYKSNYNTHKIRYMEV